MLLMDPKGKEKKMKKKEGVVTSYLVIEGMIKLLIAYYSMR